MCTKYLTQWFYAKPPLVVFLMTLVACIVTLLIISIHLQVNRLTLPDPNVKDWNSLYGRLSKIEVCSLKSNKNSTLPTTRFLKETSKNESFKSYTVEVGLGFIRQDDDSSAPPSTADSLTLPTLLSNTNLHLSITEDLLGKRVHLGDVPEKIDLIISLAGKPPKLVPHYLSTCVHFSGPQKLLPDSIVMPPSCSLNQVSTVEGMVVSASPDQTCDGPVYRLDAKQQKDLTPLLSQKEVSRIQIRIGVTSVGLLVLIIVVLCCSMCSKDAGEGGTNKSGEWERLDSLYSLNDTSDSTASDVKKSSPAVDDSS